MSTTDPGPSTPIPSEDPERCQLLGTTALIVQASMGVFVIASLVLKRQLEKQKRPWKIWIWDVGKQLVGQAVLHTLNLLISGLIAVDTNNNPCSAYLLNILIDTTFGVLIIYFALRYATLLLEKYVGWDGLKSGVYGKPPQSVFWWRQLVPYLIAVITMKVFVLLPLVLPGISTLLLRFGHAAIEYLSPSVQVIFVMAIFPLVMNVVQFCLVDQVIKGGKSEIHPDEGYERISTNGDIESSPRPRISIKPTDSLPSSPLLDAADSDKLYGSQSHSRNERSSAPSPDSDLPPFSVGDSPFGSISRLTEDVQKDARRSLSPKDSASSRQANGVRLDDL